MKKKRYPIYRQKYKRKKQPVKKIFTAIVLCIVLAVCNGWTPPRNLKEAKTQSQIFGQIFLTYIEENAKIFWDEAYIVHHLTEEIIETPVLLNESKKYGTENRVFMFTSTSKITFPGAGVSAIACSVDSMKYMCKRFSVMIISYDKMNQLRHVRFLKNKEGVLAHMAKHRRRLIPCFDAVKTAFSEELTPCGDIAHWTNPKGGYFISLYVMPGCAKRVALLCKECGLTLTGAGSAYPYHKDPQDSHLRIAPTYPSLDEVETASDLLCVCVKLAVIEKLLAEKAE